MDEMSNLVKEGQLKLVEQGAKFKKLQDDYDKFRVDVFGSANVETDADALRSRIEQLQIENMELQRFVDGVRIGGSELERRFDEATRRLIHLGIQVSQYERKATNLDRRHKALGEECDRLRVQLMRLQSGDERRLKQLSRENVNS
jgi:predicted RNase H-like nuclease (RuvC/YqgF family)